MASNALIQSNIRLTGAQEEAANAGAGAFAEGAGLITDQIEKNRKADIQAQKDALELNRLADAEVKRKTAMEEQLVEAQEKKNAYFELLDEAHVKGLISKEVFALSQEQRDAWWKDQAKAYKHGADSKTLKKRLDKVLAGEKNWQNAVKFAQSAVISESSPDAYKLDLAIELYSRENGASPPPVKEIDGVDHFVLTYIDPVTNEQEEVTVPVDQMVNMQSEEGLFGSYDKITTMGTAINGFDDSHKEVIDRFNSGKATDNDVATIGRYYDANIDTPQKKREYANSVFTSTTFDSETFLKDNPTVSTEHGDPDKLDVEDIEMMDGQPGFSPEEDAILRQIFQDSITGQYGEEQEYNNPGYTKEQETGFRVINALNRDASDLNVLTQYGGSYTINRTSKGVITDGTVKIGDREFQVQFQTDENGEIKIGENGLPMLTQGSIDSLEGPLQYKDLSEHFPGSNPQTLKTEETCGEHGHVWENGACRFKNEADIEKEENAVKDAKAACSTAGGTWDEESGTCKNDAGDEIDTELEAKKQTCATNGGTWDEAQGKCLDAEGEEIVDEESDDNQDVVINDGTSGTITSGNVQPGSVSHISQIPAEQLWRMTPGAIEAATGVEMSVDDRNLFKQHKHLNESLTKHSEELETLQADMKVECSLDENSRKCKQLTKRADATSKEITRLQGVMSSSRKDVVDKLQGKISDLTTKKSDAETEYNDIGCSANKKASRCISLQGKIDDAAIELEGLQKRFDTYYK